MLLELYFVIFFFKKTHTQKKPTIDSIKTIESYTIYTSTYILFFGPNLNQFLG